MSQPASIPDRIQFDRAIAPESLIQLRPEDAFYLQGEQVSAWVESSERMAHDIRGLLKVITAMNTIRGFIGLERPVLEMVFDLLPAERGAIVLAGDDGELIPPVLAWDSTATCGALRLCEQIAQRVLREGVALASNDAYDPDIAGHCSVMAAPLVNFGRVLGLIYLDTHNRNVRFDAGHLHLLVTIGVIAAAVLENARHLEAIERENERLRREINIEHAMVGNSARMNEVYQFIAKTARSDSTILLLGESGTGKELVARAIHQNSGRNHQPFVAINCAAITETLLESELFGYEKGAFTGAAGLTKGKLEVADGGTVFLDEIGELAGSVQAKLLRVLQEHELTRVGGTRPVKLDVRLIAATNRNLDEEARQGKFRLDLYYRLNVVSKRMPALRERREDIPLLAEYFVRKYSAKVARRVTGIGKEAESCLLNYDWPGNVRELENAIERAVVLGATDIILAEDLPESLLEAAPSESARSSDFHAEVREKKRQLICAAVAGAGGNYTRAAKLLGLHPNYLHRLIRNLDLRDTLKS